MPGYISWSAIFRIFMRRGQAPVRESGVHNAAGRPVALVPAHRVTPPLCRTVTRRHADAPSQLT